MNNDPLTRHRQKWAEVQAPTFVILPGSGAGAYYHERPYPLALQHFASIGYASAEVMKKMLLGIGASARHRHLPESRNEKSVFK